MSQQNILKLLKKKKKWMTSKEISKLLNLTSANSTLKKLYEQGEVLRRENYDWAGIGGKSYGYKIK